MQLQDEIMHLYEKFYILTYFSEILHCNQSQSHSRYCSDDPGFRFRAVFLTQLLFLAFRLFTKPCRLFAQYPAVTSDELVSSPANARLAVFFAAYLTTKR